MGSPSLSEIERRGSSPSDVLFASLLAAMGEQRLLSYLLVCGVMSNVGNKLAYVYGRERDPVLSIKKILEILKPAEYEIREDFDSVTVTLRASSCRICPKGVGGLAIPEKLCPLVGLLAGFAGIKYRAENHRREGDVCTIKYEVRQP